MLSCLKKVCSCLDMDLQHFKTKSLGIVEGWYPIKAFLAWSELERKRQEWGLEESYSIPTAFLSPNIPSEHEPTKLCKWISKWKLCLSFKLIN